jgi:hypothetical protein
LPEKVGLIGSIKIIKIGNKFMLRGTITHSLVFDKHDKGIDKQVRDSLRVYYQRNIFIDKIFNNPLCGIIAETEDECLHSTSDQGFDYTILTWEGNIFNIYDFHEECIKFVNELDENTNREWLIAGQIIDQYQNRILYDKQNAEPWKNSFWLFPITSIVNLKKWRELGKPKWGSETTADVIIGIPNEKCVHDNYTPITLHPSTDIITAKVKKGWNIVNCSLKNNLSIYNLTDGIRTAQTYLYPEVDPEKYNNFWLNLFNLPKFTDNYKKVFQSLISSKYPTRIDPSTWQCFIRNTEYYFPDQIDDTVMKWSEIETLILPSSGFKDFILSMSNKSDYHPIQVIHYDILPECIKIKKRITEQWDGTRKHFVDVLNEISKDYRKIGKENCFHMNSMKSYDEAYQDILKYFNSEEQISERWRQFQTFDHQWIYADMLDLDGCNNVKKLIKGKTSYLCLSDIAGWRSNILSYGYKNLRTSIKKSILQIKNKTIQGIVDYKDPGTDRQLWQNFDQAINYLTSETNDEKI